MRPQVHARWARSLVGGPPKNPRVLLDVTGVKWPSTRIILIVGVIWKDLRGDIKYFKFHRPSFTALTAHVRGGHKIRLRVQPLGPKPESWKTTSIGP